MSNNNLFSHTELLEESTEESPLECQKQEINRIKQYIEHHAKEGSPKIVAYLAPYGSGKSVILNNVLKKLPEEYTHIQFDIWQCANDKDIWGNFLVEALSRLKNKNKDETLDEIDGAKIDNKLLISYFLIYFILCLLAWLALKNPANEFQDFIRSFLIYALPTFLILAGINKFFPVYKSRAKTLFQYEEKLKEELYDTQHDTIVFVIEDIDRSGESGQRFLETLKCFLQKINKSIIIICPQKNVSFGESVMGATGDYHDSTMRLENSIKIYDDVIYGNMLSKIKKEEASQLLAKIGCNNAKLVNLINSLIDTSSSYSTFTIRSLKFLLRNVNSFIDAYPNADPALTFFFLSCKFLNSKKSATSTPLIKSIINSGVNLTADPSSPELKMVMDLFEINLDHAGSATYIQFEFSDLNNKSELKNHRRTNNSSWIVCEIDVKYKKLLASISAD